MLFQNIFSHKLVSINFDQPCSWSVNQESVIILAVTTHHISYFSVYKSTVYLNIVNIVTHLVILLFFWFVFPTAALPFIIMTIVFKPYQRGVYCDDESIMYPLKPDTITHGMLAAVTISCTVIIVSFYCLFSQGDLLHLTSNSWKVYRTSLI